MKVILGLVLIVAGVVLGLYVRVWLLFVGGIVEVINGAKETPANAGMIGWGLIKACFLAEVCGWLTFFVLVASGFGVMTGKERPRRRGPSNRQVELDWQRRMNEPIEE